MFIKGPAPLSTDPENAFRREIFKLPKKEGIESLVSSEQTIVLLFVSGFRAGDPIHGSGFQSAGAGDVEPGHDRVAKGIVFIEGVRLSGLFTFKKCCLKPKNSQQFKSFEV